MLNLRSARRSETGSALPMAIALVVLGAFIAVAIVIAAMSSRDTAQRQLESGATEQLVRDAGSTLAGAYDASASGEFDGFVPRRIVLQNHANQLAGGSVIDNPPGYTNVLSSVPNDANHRATVVQKLDGDREGLWQVYGVDVPEWGTTPNGTVKVYVRAWTRQTGGGAETKPLIYELVLRPEWFADYQILVDGKLRLGSTTTINGRVHSNGNTSSIFNAYNNEPWQVTIGVDGDAAHCTPTAKVTSTTGPIWFKTACEHDGGTVTVVKDQHVNILRADDAAQRMRALCPGSPGAIPTPDLKVVCTGSSTPLNVRLLGGGTVRVGGTDYNANVAAGGNQGLLVISNGDIRMSGNSLGAHARLTVVAAAPRGSSSYGSGGRPPSVYIDSDGDFGASNVAGSAFGAVAQGSIIVDEKAGCPNSVRGAFIGISGGMTSNPTWVTPFFVAQGYTCPNNINVVGSIVGHMQPIMYVSGSNAGFAQRTYSMLDSLYHNPPPMYPTASDWSVVRFAPADLSKF
jgi:hypothetical protein